MSKRKSTTLSTQKSGFLALAITDFTTTISEEMDGLDMSPDRIKIPSGGVTSFEMPAEDGEDTISVKEFSGVIIYHHPLNAFYATKYTGGSNPPDCGSFDGVTGIGDPGGSCKSCPYNQFGTGENGSKACKNRRRVYILREGELFPLLLSLPTGSLKAFTRYVKQQLSKGRKLNAVVTKFALKKAVNAGGIAYSQAIFTLDRVLEPDEHIFIETLSEQIKDYSKSVGFDTDAVAINDEDLPFEHDTGEEIQPLHGASATGDSNQ